MIRMECGMRRTGQSALVTGHSSPDEELEKMAPDPSSVVKGSLLIVPLIIGSLVQHGFASKISAIL